MQRKNSGTSIDLKQKHVYAWHPIVQQSEHWHGMHITDLLYSILNSNPSIVTRDSTTSRVQAVRPTQFKLSVDGATLSYVEKA